jgi:hypothetical protein
VAVGLKTKSNAAANPLSRDIMQDRLSDKLFLERATGFPCEIIVQGPGNRAP